MISTTAVSMPFVNSIGTGEFSAGRHCFRMAYVHTVTVIEAFMMYSALALLNDLAPRNRFYKHFASKKKVKSALRKCDQAVLENTQKHHDGRTPDFVDHFMVRITDHQNSEKFGIQNGDMMRLVEGAFEGLEAIYQGPDGDHRSILFLNLIYQNSEILYLIKLFQKLIKYIKCMSKTLQKWSCLIIYFDLFSRFSIEFLFTFRNGSQMLLMTSFCITLS